eukprot:gene11502-2093_t
MAHLLFCFGNLPTPTIMLLRAALALLGLRGRAAASCAPWAPWDGHTYDGQPTYAVASVTQDKGCEESCCEDQDCVAWAYIPWLRDGPPPCGKLPPAPGFEGCCQFFHTASPPNHVIPCANCTAGWVRGDEPPRGYHGPLLPYPSPGFTAVVASPTPAGAESCRNVTRTMRLSGETEHDVASGACPGKPITSSWTEIASGYDFFIDHATGNCTANNVSEALGPEGLFYVDSTSHWAGHGPGPSHLDSWLVNMSHGLVAQGVPVEADPGSNPPGAPAHIKWPASLVGQHGIAGQSEWFSDYTSLGNGPGQRWAPIPAGGCLTQGGSMYYLRLSIQLAPEGGVWFEDFGLHCFVSQGEGSIKVSRYFGTNWPWGDISLEAANRRGVPTVFVCTVGLDTGSATMVAEFKPPFPGSEDATVFGPEPAGFLFNVTASATLMPGFKHPGNWTVDATTPWTRSVTLSA